MTIYQWLCLLGAPALIAAVFKYIKVGNTFTEPMCPKDTLENYWFTPMYCSEVWTIRRLFKGKTLL